MKFILLLIVLSLMLSASTTYFSQRWWIYESTDADFFYHLSTGSCLPSEACSVYPPLSKVYCVLSPFGYDIFRFLVKVAIYLLPSLVIYRMYGSRIMALVWLLSPVANTLAFTNVLAQFLAMLVFLVIYKAGSKPVDLVMIPVSLFIQRFAAILFVMTLIAGYIRPAANRLPYIIALASMFVFFIFTLQEQIPRSSYTQTSIFSLCAFSFPVMVAFLKYVDDIKARMLALMSLGACLCVSMAFTYAPYELAGLLTSDFFFPRLIEVMDFIFIIGLADIIRGGKSLEAQVQPYG